MVTIENILNYFNNVMKDLRVVTICKTPDKYIIHTESKTRDDSMDGVYATQRGELKVSEYPYMAKPEEYKKALKNVVYRKK
jgi:hypothetical protein